MATFPLDLKHIVRGKTSPWADHNWFRLGGAAQYVEEHDESKKNGPKLVKPFCAAM